VGQGFDRGRPVNEVGRRGPLGRLGSSPNPDLEYKGESKPEVLSFNARRFVAVLKTGKWSGTVELRRSGRKISVIPVQWSEQSRPIMCFEDPSVSTSAVIFTVTVILLGACAWLVGPVFPGRKSIYWLVLFLGVLHLLYWAIQPVATTGDSIGYLDSVKPVFGEGRPGYFPSGYTALLGIVGIFAGRSLGSWITLIQHGMAVASAIWVYRLLGRVVSDKVALLGGMLAGALPPLLTGPQSILSETATAFAMVGTIYFAIRCRETGNWWFAIPAGFLVGLAGTLRITPLGAMLPAICILFSFPREQRSLGRLSVIAVVGMVVFVLPVMWCGYKSGQPKIAYSAGLHLYNRVVNEQRLIDEQGPATRTLLVMLQGKDPRDFRHWDVLPRLKQLSFEDRIELLHDVSLEGIAKDPVRFIGYSLLLAWRTFLVPTDGSWISTWAETPSVSPLLENPPLLSFGASSLAWRWSLNEINDILWPSLCWIAIAGTLLGLLGRHRLLVSALAWIVIAILLAAATADIFTPRYNAPIVPFVVMLAMLPIDFLQRHARGPGIASQ
jgi:hypothetical protein